MDSANKAWEEWLTLRCQSGDPAAFEDLVAVMGKPLRYYVLKLTRREDIASDILQETWMRAVHGVRGLKDPAALRAWLYSIAHGITVDHIRRDIKREQAEKKHNENYDESIEGDLRSSEEDAELIHSALDQLPPRQREILTLHFLEDFSLNQIAHIVGCPEGTVKSRLHHAKKSLKSVLMRGVYERI
jgi:RNA polymerase sigma-70 factor (ECF subfamily)